MDWTERYADRVRTLEEAAALVRSGDRVMGGLPEPAPFLAALAARRDLRDVALYVGAPRAGAIAAAANPGVTVQAPFITEAARKAAAPLEVLPVHFSGWAPFVRRWQPRVRVVLTAPPDAEGWVAPGGSLAVDDELVSGRPRPSDAVVIGLVDPNQPQIPGHRHRVEDFDVLVPLPADTAPPFYDTRKPPAHLDAFLAAVDELIPDGATLQAGVGGIPEALMSGLGHKRDLGVHTEVLGGGMVELMRSGAVTNRRKTNYPDLTLCTIALPETYEHIAGHPGVRLERAAIVLDPREVAKNRLMRCVNAALQVDLFGQAQAEFIDGVQFSGVGGQLDFHRGCGLAEDALSIITLPSTAAGGTVSRIVGSIGENAVTATRYDTQVVVTEFGVAWLRDATMRQKAERLIAIAHPDHRAQLEEEAKRARLL